MMHLVPAEQRAVVCMFDHWIVELFHNQTAHPGTCAARAKRSIVRPEELLPEERRELATEIRPKLERVITEVFRSTWATYYRWVIYRDEGMELLIPLQEGQTSPPILELERTDHFSERLIERYLLVFRGHLRS